MYNVLFTSSPQKLLSELLGLSEGATILTWQPILLPVWITKAIKISKCLISYVFRSQILTFKGLTVLLGDGIASSNVRDA